MGAQQWGFKALCVESPCSIGGRIGGSNSASPQPWGTQVANSQGALTSLLDASIPMMCHASSVPMKHPCFFEICSKQAPRPQLWFFCVA